MEVDYDYDYDDDDDDEYDECDEEKSNQENRSISKSYNSPKSTPKVTQFLFRIYFNTKPIPEHPKQRQSFIMFILLKLTFKTECRAFLCHGAYYQALAFSFFNNREKKFEYQEKQELRVNNEDLHMKRNHIINDIFEEGEKESGGNYL